MFQFTPTKLKWQRSLPSSFKANWDVLRTSVRKATMRQERRCFPWGDMKWLVFTLLLPALHYGDTDPVGQTLAFSFHVVREGEGWLFFLPPGMTSGCWSRPGRMTSHASATYFPRLMFSLPGGEHGKGDGVPSRSPAPSQCPRMSLYERPFFWHRCGRSTINNTAFGKGAGEDRQPFPL